MRILKEIESVSLKNRAKRGWVIKDKKLKVSCLVKTHNLSFMTPPLFVRFLRDTLNIKEKVPKRCFRGGKKLFFYAPGYANDHPIPRCLPPPPLLKFLKI